MTIFFACDDIYIYIFCAAVCALLCSVVSQNWDQESADSEPEALGGPDAMSDDDSD